MTKIIEISLPEYSIDRKPYYKIGQQIDDAIKDNFDTAHIAIRAIGSSDHRNYSIEELSKIILETGTDKYDPARKGVAHDDFEPYNADFQAETFEIDEITGSFFGGVMRKFYENAPIDRGYSVKIDLLLIYDLNQLITAKKNEDSKPVVDPRFERYLYCFKNPNNKQVALLGIVKIL